VPHPHLPSFESRRGSKNRPACEPHRALLVDQNLFSALARGARLTAAAQRQCPSPQKRGPESFESRVESHVPQRPPVELSRPLACRRLDCWRQLSASP